MSCDDKRFLITIFGTFAVCMVLLALFGCTTKTETISVYKPVPTVCEYNLTAVPKIETNSTQEVLDSITFIAVDYYKIRQDLYLIPCLEIKELK